MSGTNKNRGFSAIEVVLVVVVVGLVGFVGYTFYLNQIQAPDNSAQQDGDATTAPKIDTTDDLDKAGEAIDQTEQEADSSQDAKQLDSETSDL